MTDQQGFREIQLSGKQLVFLFMASVVLAVGVFLLGVSVGRGVRQASGPSSSPEAVPPAAESAATVPPPTTLSGEDTQFDKQLQGKPPTPAPVTPPVEEPAAPAPAAAEPAATPAPAPARGNEPIASAATPAASPAVKPAAPAATTARPATPAQGWMLQVGAFKSRENADAQVRELISKGYSAVVVTGGSLFRVRVGPYAQRADADRAAARLSKEEGLSPSVIR